jgi:hypothetical protein
VPSKVAAVIGLLEDAEDYLAFVAASDYDATTMETGQFKIQAEHLSEGKASPSAPSGVSSRFVCCV